MGNRFKTTPWSLILAARRDGSREDSDKALGDLCQMYWFPLYAYVRRRGHSRTDAEDITQGFFMLLFEREFLQFVDQTRGRFRSFLLTSLNHYLTDEWHRKRAAKRGGGAYHVSLDADRAEELYAGGASGPLSPEEHFDRDWAQTVVASALHDLEADYQRRGGKELFQGLKPFLTSRTEKVPYVEVAGQLGMKEAAVKTAVHRMRKRLGEAIRASIAETLDDPGQVDEEMKYLLRIL